MITNLEAENILNTQTEPSPAQRENYLPKRTRKQSWNASPNVDGVGVLSQTKCDHVLQGAIFFTQELRADKCEIFIKYK